MVRVPGIRVQSLPYIVKIRTPLLIINIILSAGLALAAPLFPDVDRRHWAGDAVAALAAKGLVEGYPDGTFKGDRAASRWELALVVARLLQRAQREHSTFATQANRQQLLSLAQALRPELEELGVRVSQLENATELLKQRVTELERLSFYGSVESRVVFQNFGNTGAVDNDSGRRGGGNPGGVGYLDYTDMVGTGPASPLRPQIHGIIPVVDYRNGKALTNGTGFTSRAILGLNIKVSPDIDAGLELGAYSSQGDFPIDAYWGVSAPYLSNPFTAGATSPNTPFTRMTLEQFWVNHKPSKTKLVVGNIPGTGMDSLVYAGQGNLGVFGPRRWPGYGFQVSGEFDDFKWEVLGTRFGNGVKYLAGNYYANYVLSGNLRYHFKRGSVGLFASRMAEEAPDGSSRVSGLTNGINVRYGASTGWNVRQWVNPPGYFVGQLASTPGAFPSTGEVRPIAGWSPLLDNSTGLANGAGNFGPQSQGVAGISARYSVPLQGRDKLTLEGRWAGSNYRPNRNSGYSADGTALHFDLGASLMNGDLNLGAEYLRIDPDYQPAAWFGNVLGGRPVKPFNFTGVFHLYNNGKYPHNRTGVRLRGDWKFDRGAGKLWAKGSVLQQTRTSLYDVRVTGGALGPVIPTNDVIGFSPGFVDTAFAGFAHPNIYGPNSGNSFTANLAPLENPRGKERQWELGASYRWDDAGLTLNGSFVQHHLFRHSALAPAQGGSQNEVDVTVDSAALDAAYDLNSKITLNAGFDWVRAAGHFDPGGLYNGVALSQGSTTLENVNSTQWIPHLGLDYDVSDSTSWSLLVRRYSTDDRVDRTVQAGIPALGQVGSTSHPFSWSGWQVSSGFELTF